MYRTIAQIDATMALLAAWFPALCTRIALPHASVQGRTVHALRVRAGSGNDRRGVLLVGGTHSRELMNPDALIELAADLVRSYLSDTDITYGARTWHASEIRLMLDRLDIWLVPCMNPDGRHYAMTVDDMWRKNLRDNPGTTCNGVDLNRNAGFLWGVTQGHTSCNPCDSVYVGSAAFSEPENRNIEYLLDTYRIVTFADVHSYSELILYPWGHAPTQTTDPGQRFTTLPTGTCTGIAPQHEEYMSPQDLQRFQTVAARIVAAIAAVRGRAYTAKPGLGLYGTTGTHKDYAYSRHIADPGRNRTYGFTFETGPMVGNCRDSFHPPDPTAIKLDTKSGLLALIQESTCAIEFIGSSAAGADGLVGELRTVRDDSLAVTEAGREWIALYERIQAPVSRIVAQDERLAREATTLFERAGELLADDRAVLDRQVALRAAELLETLIDRRELADTRDDLRMVDEALRRVSGRRWRDIRTVLTKRGPRPARNGEDTRDRGSRGMPRE